MMRSRVISKLIRCHSCWHSISTSAPSMAPKALAATPLQPQHPPVLVPPNPAFSCRPFSSRTKSRKGKPDPFRLFKIKRQTPYAHVKKLFLKIAMQHHPDLAGDKTQEEKDKSREIFIKARQAFEELVEDPETGGCCLREELKGYEPDEEHAHMDEWFKQETGFDMPFMDEETMKEVAAMTESVGGGMERGLDRDGGMWELARMVTRTVKGGGDGKNLLRLEAGEVKETEINDTKLRAKRRRN
jgi:hypothetical protein